MADFFLSNLKSTLDNCITELDEIYSVSNAVNICRAYLKHDGNETESILLIQKYLTPVKYNRKYPIHLRPKRNRDFMYRVA